MFITYWRVAAAGRNDDLTLGLYSPPINGGLKGTQQGKIDYATFCTEFQELSWMDGSRTPLNGWRLKMYIISMREVVEAYKRLLFAENPQKVLKKVV